MHTSVTMPSIALCLKSSPTAFSSKGRKQMHFGRDYEMRTVKIDLKIQLGNRKARQSQGHGFFQLDL
jgi:hypothetical protein